MIPLWDQQRFWNIKAGISSVQTTINNVVFSIQERGPRSSFLSMKCEIYSLTVTKWCMVCHRQNVKKDSSLLATVIRRNGLKPKLRGSQCDIYNNRNLTLFIQDKLSKLFFMCSSMSKFLLCGIYLTDLCIWSYGAYHRNTHGIYRILFHTVW